MYTHNSKTQVTGAVNATEQMGTGAHAHSRTQKWVPSNLETNKTLKWVPVLLKHKQKTKQNGYW